MSDIDSPPSNASFPSQPTFSVDSALPFLIKCYVYEPNSVVLGVFSITNVFIFLPLCVVILHHGLQQWRRSRSTSSAVMSHSDIFVYHIVMMEMIGVFGGLLNFGAVTTNEYNTLIVGIHLASFTYFGEMFFHILTCLERYLAVIHPITYRSLRKERGIRIRNICIGCVWLLSVCGMSLLGVNESLVIFNCFCLVLSLKIVIFCSVSVLCVLIRPGPGRQGGSRERVDKSKRRAFYTIVAILGVLMLRFAWQILLIVLYISRTAFNCTVLSCSFWVYMPTSLVLPVLFLLTKRKCVRCERCRN